MDELLGMIREQLERPEEADWEKVANLQALAVVKAGEEFKDEILGMMAEGEIRYGNSVKSVQFNDNGSLQRIEFHEPRDADATEPAG